MKYAIVENGTVTNIAVADAPLSDNWIQSNTAKIGDAYNGTEFITPVPPEPPIEEVRANMAVPRLSARLALIEAGLWDSIPPIIDAITDATEQAQTLAFFEDAQRWKRLDTTVQALGAALGLDDAGLDALFVRAQEIDASLL